MNGDHLPSVTVIGARVTNRRLPLASQGRILWTSILLVVWRGRPLFCSCRGEVNDADSFRANEAYKSVVVRLRRSLSMWHDVRKFKKLSMVDTLRSISSDYPTTESCRAC